MAYTINLTDGTILTTIPDGTLDNTTCSMALPGKNYAGYGIYLDENFVHLLENSANDTAPGDPLVGQLWWNSASELLQVWNGAVWKTISSATSSSQTPTNNVQGDLWYDTTNQQLKVYTGAQFILVGPAFTAGQGETGAIPATVLDSTSVAHTILQLYVGGTLVGIMSKDTSAWSPQNTITGFATIKPGLNLSTASNSVYLYQGTAQNATTLGANASVGLSASSFMRADATAQTTGQIISTASGVGLSLGTASTFNFQVTTGNAIISNNANFGDIQFRANVNGTPTTLMTISGANGAISGNQINANYADVAERFWADEALSPGTVVELGGSAEICAVSTDLSENVFGVISTRAAYLMNSSAGSNETHPPVAMTGRVPVKVVGQVRKGDRLVAAGAGQARAAQPGEATAFNVIGRALQDKSTADSGTVEAIVTIK
jgi:hypothetical protein